MLQRLMLFCINIFCPPISVLIIAGPGPDCLINLFFFLAGVIPGHIHGFYICCTYFRRKRKVRKGKWPGGKKTFIYSHRVWNGGASDEQVEELWMKQQREVGEKEIKKGGGRRVGDEEIGLGRGKSVRGGGVEVMR